MLHTIRFNRNHKLVPLNKQYTLPFSVFERLKIQAFYISVADELHKRDQQGQFGDDFVSDFVAGSGRAASLAASYINRIS